MTTMLSKAWNSSQAIPSSMACSMTMLALPSQIKLRSADDQARLRTMLRLKYGIEVPVLYLEQEKGAGSEQGVCNGSAVVEPHSEESVIAATSFVRLSHQIYNTEADYIALRDAILDICEKLRNGDGVNNATLSMQDLLANYASTDDLVVVRKMFDKIVAAESSSKTAQF